MKNRFFFNILSFVALLIILTNCDLGKNKATTFRIKVADINNNNLLLDSTQCNIIMSKFAVYAFNNGRKGTQFKENLDYGILSGDLSTINPYSYLTLDAGSYNANTILIEWGANDCDTLSYAISRTKHREILEAIYVNGKKTSSLTLTKNIDTGELY